MDPYVKFTKKFPKKFGTRSMNCMHLCLWKTLSQDCPHGKIRQTNTFENKDQAIIINLLKLKAFPQVFTNMIE